MKNLFKSKKGFTLVELIVVIVIIAILAAALVTSLVGYINKAKQANFQTEASNAYTAAQAYLSENLGLGKAVSYANLTAAVKTLTGADIGKYIAVCNYDANGSIIKFTYTNTVSNLSITCENGVWGEVSGTAASFSSGTLKAA